MTTREFIKKSFEGTTRKTFCSSVFANKDLNGQITVYSYGYHYPLATIIDGKGFVNNRGYSNSTAKHINWAFSALADILGYDNVLGVPLTEGDSLTLKGIQSSATRENERLVTLMDSKKRKDTQVYKWLKHDNEKTRDVLTVVRELIETRQRG